MAQLCEWTPNRTVRVVAMSSSKHWADLYLQGITVSKQLWSRWRWIRKLANKNMILALLFKSKIAGKLTDLLLSICVKVLRNRTNNTAGNKQHLKSSGVLENGSVGQSTCRASLTDDPSDDPWTPVKSQAVCPLTSTRMLWHMLTLTHKQVHTCTEK